MPESFEHDEEYLIAGTNSVSDEQLQHADTTASPQQTDFETRGLSEIVHFARTVNMELPHV